MNTTAMRVSFSYLDRQFEDIDDYLSDIRKLVKAGDFTLGASVRQFEEAFAKLCRLPYAIGVGSGTDALILSLKVLGIGSGDEVITTPMTFIATVGAIVATGAKPIFVDSEDGFVIDPSKIEAAVTKRAKAILPVHYTGNVADMDKIRKIAEKYNLKIVEDASQAIGAAIGDKPVGSWGETACFSLHPLKNLNVWGDGGIIATRSRKIADEIMLLRNHGLVNRDEVVRFGVNSRLDGLQAVIGNRLMGQIEQITQRRIENARRYDEALGKLTGWVQIPKRRPGVKHVFHLYMVRVKKRNELLRHLNENGVEAKVHYPIPIHLQVAAKHLGYKKGDFPVCEADCQSIITLPGHQHLTVDEVDYVISQVQRFYQKA